MAKINKLAEVLSERGKAGEGLAFDVNPIPGKIEVLQVLVEDREELPIYISQADHEILCLSYLFKKDEVKAESINDMHDAMLSMNVPMPLSAFAQIGDQYVVFGALSINSAIEEIVHEIELLSDNTLEAIKSLKDYLK